MVRKVGAPFDLYYLGAYTTANFEIHASLASAMREDNKDRNARRAQRLEQSDFALFCSAILLVEVIRSQNKLFTLGLHNEIQATDDAVAMVWKEAIDARSRREKEQ
jgi:hypothetical protein